MKTTKKLCYYLTLSLAAAFFVISCKKSHNPAPQTTNEPTIKITANATLGSTITDKDGRSIYFFAKDAGSTSVCAGQCAVTWPPFYQENPMIGPGLSASDFAVITRADGTRQTTYKGWPMYYYSGDTMAGDTKGDAYAKLWIIAKPDYTVMFANAQLVGLDGANYNDQGVAATGASTYLTDASGHTLYLFTKDTHNTNTFTKADLSNNATWSIFEVASVGSIPTVFDKTLFATVTIYGKVQLVYNGHPLYLFGQDNMTRGSTKGVSFPTPGAAIWKVVNTTTLAL